MTSVVAGGRGFIEEFFSSDSFEAMFPSSSRFSAIERDITIVNVKILSIEMHV
jgi:hypothetical protein